MDIHGLSPEELRVALWSCFPSLEIFHGINGEKGNSSFVSCLRELAFEKKLAEKNTEPLFEELIRMNCELHKGRRPTQEFTFETLLAEIKKERSIKSLVAELKEAAQRIGLEGPDEVLFTRMKKDSHAGSLKRRHALLLLSLWLGLNKPDLALSYADLTGFPKSTTGAAVDESEGVLAVFAFTGENIDAATVDFLKRELPACIRDLKLTYLNEKRLTYLATTCMARFPVTEGGPGLPKTYGQAMRDALSLAYQMIVTWQLSEHHSRRLSLFISIDAGEFSSREIMIKELMSPDLPPESPIRLSHFAYTAAMQADLKVVFRQVKYPNVWSAQNFWCFPYFKNPPVLMPEPSRAADTADILPVTDEAVRRFRDSLFAADPKEYGILSVVDSYPPKILASLEIAHVTTLRRLHHEAVQILAYVLSFDPLNHIARTLRMHNFMALATCSKDQDASAILFDRAVHDALFIEKHCMPDPEFFSEYSLVYWSRAIKLIKLLRKGIIDKDKDKTMDYVIELLEKGEESAKKGLASSTSGAD
ncbi:MAG TPA: hypothetical protein PLM29_16040, partial [Deltaproteobacteria bacterium]|nr:hypothetical protein [Deltaproteobacteria bacterium]